MLKKITLALALGSLIPGFASAAYACGGSGGSTTCSMDMGGDGSGTSNMAPPVAIAANSPAVAKRPTRSYRSYSYQPSYSGMRTGGARGWNSGVRGAASKSLGNYGR